MSAEKKQSLTIRFPISLLSKIRERARILDRSLGYTIRKLLEEKLGEPK